MKNRLFIQKVGTGFNQVWLSELTMTKGWWIFKRSVPLAQFEHNSLNKALDNAHNMIKNSGELTIRLVMD